MSLQDDYDRIKQSPFFVSETTHHMTVVAAGNLAPGTLIIMGAHGAVRAAELTERPIGSVVSTPCTHCKRAQNEHAPGGKCLFESTTYATDGTVTIRLNSKRY